MGCFSKCIASCEGTKLSINAYISINHHCFSGWFLLFSFFARLWHWPIVSSDQKCRTHAFSEEVKQRFLNSGLTKNEGCLIRIVGH